MGSILRFPKGGRVSGAVTGRAMRGTEVKFRYPGPDAVSEVSCYSEPRPKRAAARSPRVTRSA
jgi:hypothetical protein